MQSGCYVYILKCADGKYYVGTYRGRDLATRVGEHNSGKDKSAWTFKHRPVDLQWSTFFSRFDEAIAFEKQIKKWSRAKKEAPMSGDVAQLKQLSVSRSAPADPAKARFPRHKPL